MMKWMVNCIQFSLAASLSTPSDLQCINSLGNWHAMRQGLGWQAKAGTTPRLPTLSPSTSLAILWQGISTRRSGTITSPSCMPSWSNLGTSITWHDFFPTVKIEIAFFVCVGFILYLASCYWSGKPLTSVNTSAKGSVSSCVTMATHYPSLLVSITWSDKLSSQLLNFCNHFSQGLLYTTMAAHQSCYFKNTCICEYPGCRVAYSQLVAPPMVVGSIATRFIHTTFVARCQAVHNGAFSVPKLIMGVSICGLLLTLYSP